MKLPGKGGTPCSITALGDHAIRIRLGDEVNAEVAQRVQAVAAYLEAYPFAWLLECILSYTTVTVVYDPVVIENHFDRPDQSPFEILSRLLKNILTDAKEVKPTAPRKVEIPVCYGGMFGPDLQFVAEYHGMTPEEVIALHSQPEYRVYMIGFAPGFPYLGGLPERLVTPRRNTPRVVIPVGSVGIGGSQTGIYPLATPGGWHLIGKTPRVLFDPAKDPPTLLKPGDIIKFLPVTKREYGAWEEDDV